MAEGFSQVSRRGWAAHKALKDRKEHSKNSSTRWLTKLPHFTLPWLTLHARLDKQFLEVGERELHAQSTKGTESGVLRA